jgi:serine/threonine-protein kinase
MGAVWQAEHTTLRIPCAVKFLHPCVAISREVRKRFEREAVTAALLRSPHVVQILDHGMWGETPYIAMELLEGEDLAHRLQRVGRLSSRETASIVTQVARALTRAHAAGLVHRDLKPANVFLVRDDDREVVKVLDFGVAKIESTGADGLTESGAMLGTPRYMSPEQARGLKTVDHRSDLWALAVVTFQCLTGATPFHASAVVDVLLLIASGPLPVPSQIAPVPPGFDVWWQRAASRDPAGRFQSARELAESLLLALGLSGGDITEMGLSASPSLLPAPGPSSAAFAAVSAADTPARSRARILVMAGAAVSLLGAGVLLGWEASSRPSDAAPPGPVVSASSASASPPDPAANVVPGDPVPAASVTLATVPVPAASATAPTRHASVFQAGSRWGTPASSAPAPGRAAASASASVPAPPPPAPSAPPQRPRPTID